MPIVVVIDPTNVARVDLVANIVGNDVDPMVQRIEEIVAKQETHPVATSNVDLMLRIEAMVGS